MGCSPPLGYNKQYGAHCIKDYAGRISELYHVGEGNATQKMSPAQMWEVLQKENPGCYKLPTEMDIRTEISKLAHRPSEDKSEEEERPSCCLPSARPLSQRPRLARTCSEQADFKKYSLQSANHHPEEKGFLVGATRLSQRSGAHGGSRGRETSKALRRVLEGEQRRGCGSSGRRLC
jgi:hypothetical protein